MTDHNARQAGLLDLINAYGRACRRDGSPAWESEEGQALHQFLAAHSADARNGEGVGLADRLLAALERASAAESSLRALVDECDNDSTPGWEERMAGRIAQANRLLAAPAAPARKRTHSDCDGRPRYSRRFAPAPAAQADERALYNNWCAEKGRVPTAEGFIDWRDNGGAIKAQQSVTLAECTCPSGNGSLRYPCPVHAEEAVKVMCGCGDQYPMDSYEAGFIEGRGHCENCDAMSATPAEPVINESALTAAVWQRICELPGRNSPEGEPDACVLNLREFSGCMANALEDLNLLPPQGISPADAASEADKRDAERWRTHMRLMQEEGNSERGIRSYLEIIDTAVQRERQQGAGNAN